jgi:hypothetical protein
MTDKSARDVNADPLIFFETTGAPGTDQTERAFLDSDKIMGYSGTGILLLEIADGVVKWGPQETATDSFKVLVTSTDPLPEYLHSSIQDNATYVTKADIIVASATDTTDAKDYKERFFVDVSAITGYSDKDFFLLALEDNQSKYVTSDAVAAEIFNNLTLVGITFVGDTLTATAVEKNRLIRGLCKGAVAATMSTFPIDGVLPLSGGLDPVSGNPVTEVTVSNVQKEAFPDNTPVTAIWNGTNWELLLVERRRIVRGMAVGNISSVTNTFSIDNIKTLSSGVDPRSNPASSAETLTVNNVYAKAWQNDADVIAIFNSQTNQWEATFGHVTHSIRFARVYDTITPATNNLAANWGGGQVKFMNDDTGVLDVDPTDVDNTWIDVTFATDTQVTVDVSYNPPRVINGTCDTVSWV